MIVNTPISNIYRYFAKNPEIMSKYNKEVLELRKNITTEIESHAAHFEQNMEPLFESPASMNLFMKIGELFTTPGVAGAFIASKSKLTDLCQPGTNFVDHMKGLSEIKASLRRAFRKSPEGNEIAKDLIKEIKSPENKGVFDVFDSYIKAFAPDSSESMANFYIDAANLAPKEIRSDYHKAMKTNSDYANRPAQETFSELFENLIKK